MAVTVAAFAVMGLVEAVRYRVGIGRSGTRTR
jgi:hypothetical protein